MFKTKSLAAILLVVTVLFAQVGTVFAAPPLQTGTTTITGTVTDIQTETTNGVTTVLVTVLDPTTNTSQTVRLSVETAAGLFLLQLDPVTQQPILDPTTNEPLVDQTKLNQPISIDSSTVIPDGEQPTEPINPISTILADFFKVDASTVQDLHNDGFGFGVIVQALWMSKSLTESESGDATIAKCILDARKNGTYNTCFEFGDEPVPTNWGQFKKAIFDNKEKHNLGVIVSGHVNNGTDVTTTNSLKEHGSGKDKHQNKNNKPDKSNSKP
jgi:hypothetical protein